MLRQLIFMSFISAIYCLNFGNTNVFAPPPEETEELGFDQFIIGGSSIRINAVTYQISLMANGSHTCGGAIISPDWVFTAAHCTQLPADQTPYNPYTKGYRVRAGSTYRDAGGELYYVWAVYNHPNYTIGTATTYYTNDFSLLKMWDKILYTPVIQPVGLPTANELLAANTPVYISGWGFSGYDAAGNPIRPKILQGADMLSQAANYVTTNYNYASLYDTHICVTTASTTIGMCKGDSGGPIIKKSDGKLHGVASFVFTLANGQCDPTKPGVYARIAAVRPWVLSTTGI